MDECVEHGTIRSMSVYILQASFFAMRFINDLSCREEDKRFFGKEKGTVSRNANVHVIEGYMCNNARDFYNV